MAILFKKVKAAQFALCGMAPTQITAMESPRLLGLSNRPYYLQRQLNVRWKKTSYLTKNNCP